MHLESMHKVLKHIYFDGKRITRIDKVCHRLLKLVRDKVFSRLISLARNRTVSLSNRGFHERHRRGKQMLDDGHVTQMEQGIWLVTSSKSEDQHTVLRGTPGTCECRERCPAADCGVCRHSFICECEDFSTSRNICKHAHAVGMFASVRRCDRRDDTETELNMHMENVCAEAGNWVSDSPSLRLKTSQDALHEELQQIMSQIYACSSLEAVEVARASSRKAMAALSVATTGDV